MSKVVSVKGAGKLRDVQYNGLCSFVIANDSLVVTWTAFGAGN